MNFPDSPETELTERIMARFSQYAEEPIIKLDVADYNKIFSHVYRTIRTQPYLDAIKLACTAKSVEEIEQHFSTHSESVGKTLDEAVEIIEGAMRIKNLWCNDSNKVVHCEEDMAVSNMAVAFEYFLEKINKTK